jgi:hypothetical protein
MWRVAIQAGSTQAALYRGCTSGAKIVLTENVAGDLLGGERCCKQDNGEEEPKIHHGDTETQRIFDF